MICANDLPPTRMSWRSRPISRCKDMTGDKLVAEKAKEWGLIWEVADDCVEAAMALAARLALMPTKALVATRDLLREAGQLTHRRLERVPQKRSKPRALVATEPDQIYCWDITY